jgi:hypothetical protein
MKKMGGVPGSVGEAGKKIKADLMDENEDKTAMTVKRDSRNEVFRVTESGCHHVFEWSR